MSIAKIRSIALIILGDFLYALTVQLFLTPSGIITGGGTGIGIFVNLVTHIPVSSVVFVLNVIMLVLGWFVLGKEFALTTIISTFAIPFSLAICEQVFAGVVLTNDMMLSAVFAGLGIGLALGIVIRQGASTGGMDIPPLVLKKLVNIPVSFSMMVADVLILFLQTGVSGWEILLYGIVNVLIYTITMDRVLTIGTSRIEIKVISQKSEEICRTILKEVDRGVTVFNAKGGYSGQRQDVLLTVVSSRELPRIEKLVHAIDEDAFLIVGSAGEVRGRGFTLQKRYAGNKGGNDTIEEA